MTYRTKTYIAADWDGDKDAVDQIKAWEKSVHWGLSFGDVHESTGARDSSLNCSIKRSLATRFNVSKTFVLIVGSNTIKVRSGSCQYCGSHKPLTQSCDRWYTVDNRSYIQYECEKAVKDGLKIIVLYNAASVNKYNCPDSVRNIGTHKAMKKYQDGQYSWDYQAVKSAFDQ